MGQREKVLEGRLVCHPDGYGFVVREEASPDIFIPPGKLKNAVHGDRVRVRWWQGEGGRRRRRRKSQRPEGEIVDVLSRAQDSVIGKIFRYRGDTYLAPLDKRYHYVVWIPEQEGPAPENSMVVAAEILAQPTPHDPPIGRIVTVLGHADDPDIQYQVVCQNYEIPTEFPEEVVEQADQVAAVINAEDFAGRSDYRDELTVTIDGESAKDFDDAVSLVKEADGSFVLKVHIADVSHYVREGSPIDVEAFVRGTSVYFPDRAIPMLPEALSNHICSLRPDVDRLTVTTLLHIDEKGRLIDSHFHPSIIRSRGRLTYEQVQSILDGADEGSVQEEGLRSMLQSMLELERILHQKRKKEGSIDFDLPEAEIDYDPEGTILDIVRAERNEAHRIIEEFMLLSNQAVARFLEEQEVPLIYRIHEEPDPVQVEEFAETAARLGFTLLRDGASEARPQDFQRVSEKLAGSRFERFLNYLMLRSFKQACYSIHNKGHFGLAFDCYTHFTSPIRRYPDLIVHRILKSTLSAQKRQESVTQDTERLEQIAEQSSTRERAAVDAEREIMKWLMARFMSERIGKHYEGFVVSVRDNGMFVELLDHFVEGFVPVASLWDDYYHHYERDHCLVGENNGRVFRIGDTVTVRVDKVDPDRHLIDFSVVLDTPGGRSRKGRKGSSSRKKRRRRKSRH